MYARWAEFKRQWRKPNGVVERQRDGDGTAGGEADGEGYGIGDAVFARERTLSYADITGNSDFDVHVSLEESDYQRQRRAPNDGIKRRRAVVAEHVGVNSAVDEHGKRIRQGRGLRLTFFLMFLFDKKAVNYYRSLQ